MGPVRRASSPCPAPSRADSPTPLFPPSYFLPGCGARRARCKVGLCTGGVVWRRGPASSREQRKVVAREGGSRTPGGGLLCVGGNGTGPTSFIQPVPFFGFLFCSSFRKRRAMPEHSAGLPHLGGQLLAGCGCRGGGGAQPPARPALSCKRRPWRC